ncbi:uncharacterized protein [Amphiura filiformis]|uniref:uncharacterized protein n=1 Tax=Amphiura filiformis TaxID=82378 RepID=UPI003B226DDE
MLSGSKEEAQLQVQAHSETAKEVGLLINTGETEVITSTSCKNCLNLDGDEIKLVEDFRYLGSMMASSDRTRTLAWDAVWKLDRIWKSSHIPTEPKIIIFLTACLSIFLYGYIARQAVRLSSIGCDRVPLIAKYLVTVEPS